MACQDLLDEDCGQTPVSGTGTESVIVFHVGSPLKGEARLPRLYTPVVGENTPLDVQAASLGKEAGDVLDSLLERLYNGEKLTSDRKLLRATAKDYVEALQRGYGNDLTGLEWDSPDFATLEKLTENVYQFAAAKNYHELKDLSMAVRDGNHIRTFEEFQKEAEAIIGKHNRNWLRAEYNQVVAAAQAGARWNDYKSRSDAMPFLQYQCVMDGNTRPEHAALHGVIKRIDDPFWDKYYPPNGWGCRCEAVQLPGSSYKETPDSEIHPPVVAPMFQVNFGKQGVAFPEGHAYFRNMPDEIWEQCSKEARNLRIAQIREEATQLLKDKHVIVDGFDKEITFTGRGIKEYLNQPHAMYMTKNEALLTMDKRLEASTYHGPLEKQDASNRFETHVFETEMKGQKTWLLVRDYDNADNCSLYSISDNESILQHLKK